MQKTEVLTSGNYYHIYNCGINGTQIFKEPNNYEHFLFLYDKYIEPIADTIAWVLMGNHFHFLVSIKENVEYKYSKAKFHTDSSNADSSGDTVRFEEVKWQTTDLPAREASDCIKKPKPHLHFSHMFNAYTKYFNKRYSRHGTLFERPFKRKWITNKYYLKQVILYIHNNPVHHGFCRHPLEYPWSSYLSSISVKTTWLKQKSVIGWFDDVANFKYMHNKKVDAERIEKMLEI
ncbi:transposase [Bacteroidota bacterium]